MAELARAEEALTTLREANDWLETIGDDWKDNHVGARLDLSFVTKGPEPTVTTFEPSYRGVPKWAIAAALQAMYDAARRRLEAEDCALVGCDQRPVED